MKILGTTFQAAFSDKVCIDEARLYMGECAAAFGRQEGNHSGEFMGIPATGKRIEIRYMDFWKVVDGKIVDNWVSVDFPHVSQLGKDAFEGNGWEVYDRGECVAPAPKAKLNLRKTLSEAKQAQPISSLLLIFESEIY